MTRDDIALIKNALTRAIVERNKSEIYQIIQRFFHSEYISVLIHNPKNRSLYGVYLDYAIDTKRLDQNSILGEAFERKQARLYKHITSEKNFNPKIDNPYDTKLKSQIIVPVMESGELIGIIRLSKQLPIQKSIHVR